MHVSYILIKKYILKTKLTFNYFFSFFFYLLPATQDQDTTKVIPEETDLNNSKLTVASQDEVKHNQTNGKGSSIADERNGKDDAT